MPAPRKHPQELRDRAIRLVGEAMSQEASLSLNAAVIRIGHRTVVDPDTLRGWVKQSRIKDLERENRELKRVNEILLAA